MVHPRVRTLSENKDSDPLKTPLKPVQYNDKAASEYHPLCLLSAKQAENSCEHCAGLIEQHDCVVVVDVCDSKYGEGGKTGEDPWDAPELQDDSPCWSDLCVKDKVKRVLMDWFLKPVSLVSLLYLFVCSLDFLASAFRLLGGKTAGQALSSSVLLQNPVCGLMLGILATVLVQSSSTSTSILIAMVASQLVPVRAAIFIVMGANIGTSVTNTVVSMAQAGDRDQFRRAFAGATLHDMFNWLAVIVLLPLEVATGYLYHLTTWMTRSIDSTSSGCGDNTCKSDFLKKLTKPFTSRVIQLDKKVIEGIALGREEYLNKSLIKKYCGFEEVTFTVNSTLDANSTNISLPHTENITRLVGTESCNFLLQGLSDQLTGILLLSVSLVLLCSCLVCIVKLLNSVLKGKIAKLVKKIVNAELPGKFSYFTGYLAMLLGAGLTVLVQSSSVFTSAMTPLVGVGVIKLERMYPLTLGSNLGTTATGLLAALAASSGGGKLQPSIQIALVHLCFNISGILLFYPIPRLRFPIAMAKAMGNRTARYRWFAGLYLMGMFLLLPVAVFGLTMAGRVVLITSSCLLLLLLIPVIVLNFLQRSCRSRLPERLRTWDFLPFEWMHSLRPLDRLIISISQAPKRLCCLMCSRRACLNQGQAEKGVKGHLGVKKEMAEDKDNSLPFRGSDSLFVGNCNRNVDVSETETKTHSKTEAIENNLNSDNSKDQETKGSGSLFENSVEIDIPTTKV